MSSKDKSSKGVLEKTKLEVASKITEVLGEHKRMWRVFSEKQQVLHQLIDKKIEVSKTFIQYYIFWRQSHEIRSNLAASHHVYEIDKQVQILSEMLDQFQVKSSVTNQMLEDFIAKMLMEVDSIKKSLDLVPVVKTLEDLENIPIPDVEWLQDVPDPEVDLLTQEWQQMSLEPKINVYLRQIQILLALQE